MNEVKGIFEQTFASNYLTLKPYFPSQQKAALQALELAKLVIQGQKVEESLIEKWSLEMYRKYDVGFDIIKIPVLRTEEERSWYSPKLLLGAFFWTRYRDYLIRVKHWDQEVVKSIDNSTNEIMRSLGNPREIYPFDKRGLILGYVQSGKTANFTGLINKAYDVGYKLVIVLSGIHNDLRAQTQLRLDEEVIGSKMDKAGKPVGVTQIYDNTPNHIISSWTTVERDISSEPSGIRSLNQRTLMVVKKNSIVLESLKNQLEYQKNLFNLDIPVLIIDDEADQASVDTSKVEDPKTINKLIRQILEIFDRRCYVGYTATPFANLLINAEAKTEDEGKDLYPKDFLVGLPKPKEYCGPEEFFNVEEDADDPRPSLIRPLSDADIEVFTGIKTKGDADKFEEVPPQMEESILAFLLTIAVRNLRGQRNKHNSMLIHTSRFKDVQSSVKDGVDKVFNEIITQIQYNKNSKIVKAIRKLYEKDIIPTSRAWPGDMQEFKWEEVYQELRESSKKVRVLEINGNSKDALDYDQYKEDGLNVIAVGGDKLSRGLTLEGLSITYYFRNTLMYDTLMQMGRWFGYRKGYMDLCRIYTTAEIASNFEHLAIAMIELRREFDRLAKSKKTPLEYAVKMLCHPTMTLTSPLKMRNATITNVIYRLTLQQTRIYENKESFFAHNMRVTERFINKLSSEFKKKSIGSRKTGYYIAQEVGAEKVLAFLSEYKTSQGADKVDSSKIVNYIQQVNEIGELLYWTVAVVVGDPSDKSGLEKFPVRIGSLEIGSAVVRGVKAEEYNNKGQDKIDIRAIVASRQEFIDLNQATIKNEKDKQVIRGLRSKERGMLLIYPLHPKVKVFDSLGFVFSKHMVPIGFGISFPDSDLDDFKIYEVNRTIK
ncbi:endonuclease [Paenibacillus larvae subsp. pulvifaciens]|uniref:Endonuclease n=1 Tax=Paenibacillus larvae subsp. pulvifaciens TaxID=1477 RepID=A0A1V0UNT6_9BACL|nr:Z1 domain-containing protein [Paenibacillus larvae]ARF66919.1 endonuclease [Paenibacillus larvae subsp. pulvifaciens]